jgi:hypothetical protein
MKLESKVLALAISGILLSGCSVFGREQVEYSPINIKPLFGNKARNPYAELAQHSYRPPVPQGGGTPMSYETKRLLMDKDRKLEELQNQVTTLTEQVQLLLAMTQKNNERTQELVKTSMTNAAERSSGFRFNDVKARSVETSKKVSQPTKIKREVIRPKENKSELLVAKSSGLVKASIQKASSEQEQAMVPKSKPKPVNEIKKIEIIAKTEVKEEVSPQGTSIPNNQPGVHLTKSNTADNIKQEPMEPKPEIGKIKLVGVESIQARNSSTRTFLKPTNKIDKKTPLKGPIDVVVRFESKKLRDYYFKMLKMRGYRDIFTRYSASEKDWLIYMGRFETFRRAHATYKVVGRYADKGTVQMLYGEKAISI